MDHQTTLAGATRRTLLLGGGAALLGTAAAAAARPATLLAAPAAQGTPADLARGELEDWAPLVGRTFSLAASAGAALKLVSVAPSAEDGERPSALKRKRAFTAVFEAAGPAPQGNATYWLSRHQVAPFPVFLGPPSKDGTPKLVAVFG